MQILWKLCGKTDFFKTFSTQHFDKFLCSHSLRVLQAKKQIVGQKIRENIGNDFFGILVYFFIIEKEFLDETMQF